MGGIIFSDNGAAIVSRRLILQAANLTLSEIRNVLHSEVLYRDSFGYETRFSITLFGEGDDEDTIRTIRMSWILWERERLRFRERFRLRRMKDIRRTFRTSLRMQTAKEISHIHGNEYGRRNELCEFGIVHACIVGFAVRINVHLRVSVVHTDFGGFSKLSGNFDSFGVWERNSGGDAVVEFGADINGGDLYEIRRLISGEFNFVGNSQWRFTFGSFVSGFVRL